MVTTLTSCCLQGVMWRDDFLRIMIAYTVTTRHAKSEPDRIWTSFICTAPQLNKVAEPNISKVSLSIRN